MNLSLIVSNELVTNDAPLSGDKSWDLGTYMEQIGGVSVQGKKTYGIYTPFDVKDEEV